MPSRARRARGSWLREAKLGLLVDLGAFQADHTRGPGQDPVKERARLARDAGLKTLVVSLNGTKDLMGVACPQRPWVGCSDATGLTSTASAISQACRDAGLRLGWVLNLDGETGRAGVAGASGLADLESGLEGLLSACPNTALFSLEAPDMPPSTRNRLANLVRRQCPECLLEGASIGSGDFLRAAVANPASRGQSSYRLAPVPLNTGWASSGTWLSAEDLIWQVVSAVGDGAGAIVCVPTPAEGGIPDPATRALMELGRWLKVNAAAIYGTDALAGGASLARRAVGGDQKLQWRFTKRPGRLFVHLPHWPGSSVCLSELEFAPSRAFLLADRRHAALPLSQGPDGVEVALPETPPGAPPFVLCLQSESR